MKAAQAHAFEQPAQRELAPSDPARSEIRVLEDFELVLAGGGEGDFEWP